MLIPTKVIRAMQTPAALAQEEEDRREFVDAVCRAALKEVVKMRR